MVLLRFLASSIALVLWTFGTLLAVAPAGAEPTKDPDAVIWCHDEARSIVAKRARWKCSGVEVNEAEAQAIKRARVSRIQRVLKRSENPLVPDHKLSGTGTGFVVTRDGAVLTNHHVIDGCDVVTVSPVNASETVAYLGPSEPRMDLAVVVAKGLDRKPAAFRRNYTLTEGEPLSVVGYPLHGKVLIKPRVVTGSVREPIPRQPPGVFAMNIDVRRGNSGGPVLDRHGNVAGVVVATLDTPRVFSRTGELIRNVGFGIRLEVVSAFVERHRVKISWSPSEPDLSASQLRTVADQMVVQVRCYVLESVGRRRTAPKP